MRRVRTVVMALALVTASGGVVPGARTASPVPAPEPAPAIPGPAARLLVAVPDLRVPEAAGPVDLGSRLRLADPAAEVLVVSEEAPARVSGPFRISWAPPAGPETAATLHVETASGPPFQMDLAAVAVPSHHTGIPAAILEVLGGPEGVAAWRTGRVVLSPLELRLPAWDLPGPDADAVMLEGAWWTLVSDAAAGIPATQPQPVPAALRARVARTPVSRLERLVDASLGDVTADGVVDLALSFRRPFQRTLLNVSRPRRAWVDADGRSAHVGLFRPGDLSSIWVAGTLVRPVRHLAACTGGLAVAYSTLRRPAILATTAWAWQGFGFLPLPELSGTGRPTCIDIDRDGRPDAAIIERG